MAEQRPGLVDLGGHIGYVFHTDPAAMISGDLTRVAFRLAAADAIVAAHKKTQPGDKGIEDVDR